MFYLEVFKKLNDQNVRYLVAGGIAVNLYGVPRMTYDLDILIALDESNILRALNAMELLSFLPRLPVDPKEFTSLSKRMEWKNKKNMTVFSFTRGKGFETIDIFIDNPIEFELSYRRRVDFEVEGVKIPAVSVEDLVALKTIAGRLQDIDDIESLRKTRNIK